MTQEQLRIAIAGACGRTDEEAKRGFKTATLDNEALDRIYEQLKEHAIPPVRLDDGKLYWILPYEANPGVVREESIVPGKWKGIDYPGAPLKTAEDRLAELAEQFVVDTERYDREVCTGPIKRGGIMPANAHERKLVISNAGEVCTRMYRDFVEPLKFTHTEWRCAIQRARKRMPMD